MSATDPLEAELEASRAPFMEHLEELRWRLWRAVIGVLVAAIVCGFFHNEIYDFFTNPAYEALETLKLKAEISYRQPTGAFMFHFKAVMIAALFFAVPIIMWHIWHFVAPGLYRNERRMAIPFVIMSTVCFVGGAAFAYYLVLPPAFEFLLGFGTQGPRALRPDLNLEDYLGFTTKLLLAFGIVFEMPIAVGFFSGIGLITHHTMIKWWRWAIVIAFVAGAVLTPPDYVTQTMLAIPLVALYGLSIGIAYLITTRREASAAAREAEWADDDGEPAADAVDAAQAADEAQPADPAAPSDDPRP